MKYYKSCVDLPLKNFLNVIEHNDYKYLAITKDYDFKLKDDLTELWEVILYEYAELGGDKKTLERFNAFRELHQLIATYKIISAMIYTLYYKYNKQYIHDLSLFGYVIDIKDNLIQIESLERCSQQSRAILNEIDSLKRTLEPGEETAKEKNIFYKALAPLIEHYGNLDDGITVAKYIELKNNLINGRNKGR